MHTQQYHVYQASPTPFHSRQALTWSRGPVSTKTASARGSKDWLGGRDSNPDSMVQSHVSYRWTTAQCRTLILAKSFWEFNGG